MWIQLKNSLHKLVKLGVVKRISQGFFRAYRLQGCTFAVCVNMCAWVTMSYVLVCLWFSVWRMSCAHVDHRNPKAPRKWRLGGETTPQVQSLESLTRCFGQGVSCLKMDIFSCSWPQVCSNHSHRLYGWETINLSRVPHVEETTLVGAASDFSYVGHRRAMFQEIIWNDLQKFEKVKKCWKILLAILVDQNNGKAMHPLNLYISTLIWKNLQAAITNRQKQVSGTLFWTSCHCTESFIENNTTAIPRKLHLSWLRRQRNLLYSFFGLPPGNFQPNILQTRPR